MEPGKDTSSLPLKPRLNIPFKKKNLGNIIAEIFKQRTTETHLCPAGPLEKT